MWHLFFNLLLSFKAKGLNLKLNGINSEILISALIFNAYSWCEYLEKKSAKILSIYQLYVEQHNLLNSSLEVSKYLKG